MMVRVPSLASVDQARQTFGGFGTLSSHQSEIPFWYCIPYWYLLESKLQETCRDRHMRIEITNVESNLSSPSAQVSYILNGHRRSISWGELDMLGEDRLKRADREQTGEQCLLAQAALMLRARKMERGEQDSEWWAGLNIDQTITTGDGTSLRRSARVWFDNGDSLVTTVNGTEVSIRSYYVGQTFNLGNGDHDCMTTGRAVEFL